MKLLEEKRLGFKYDKYKESFSPKEVEELLIQYTASLEKPIGELVATNETKLKELETRNSEFESQVTDLTGQLEEKETAFNSLNEEFAPIKEAQFKTHVTELLKGKVAEGAEMDAYSHLTKIEDFNEEKVDGFVDTLLQEKAYLSPKQGNTFKQSIGEGDETPPEPTYVSPISASVVR